MLEAHAEAFLGKKNCWCFASKCSIKQNKTGGTDTDSKGKCNH